MPHFVIDYATDVLDTDGVTQLMNAVYQAGCNSGVMLPADIKIRARAFEHYRLVNPGDTFVHVTAYLLAGRTDTQKEYLAVLVRDHLHECLPNVSSLSVDIRDMNPAAYKKRLLDPVID